MNKREDRPKLAVYWCASCGGCDVALVDLGEDLLKIAELAEIVFWPCAMDFKLKDVEAMPDKSIDFCLVNGAVRNEDDEKNVKLLRSKSKYMVAYGSCSCFGGIPGLANFFTREELLERVYSTESTDKPEKMVMEETVTEERTDLRPPELLERVKPLDEVVNVDFYIPGCPPQLEQTAAALNDFLAGKLDRKHYVSSKSVCDECPRQKEDKKLAEPKREYEIEDDGRCLLEQGILCMGLATAGGCNARCIRANSACIGCNGPTLGAKDQGARFINAVAGALGLDQEEKRSEEELDKMISKLADPAGVGYKFSLAKSLLKRKWIDYAGAIEKKKVVGEV
jgi:F420-non-reducing hydrogenase small subunit